MRRRGINIHRFCEGYGIDILPPRRSTGNRPANIIYGGKTVRRLLRDYGEDHTGTVLRCIQVAAPTELWEDTLSAVSRFLLSHKPQTPRRELIVAFANVDLAALRARATRLVVGHRRMPRRVDVLLTLIADRMLP